MALTAPDTDDQAAWTRAEVTRAMDTATPETLADAMADLAEWAHHAYTHPTPGGRGGIDYIAIVRDGQRAITAIRDTVTAILTDLGDGDPLDVYGADWAEILGHLEQAAEGLRQIANGWI